VLLAVLCGGILGLVAALRARGASTEALLRRLPDDGSIIVFADFKALRSSGLLELLSSSPLSQEPEYRIFVERTGFDYLNDLDSVLVSVHSTGTYFVLTGRFDWKNLQEYVQRQGGVCHNTLCQTEGSTPARKISYFPLRPGIMALAVSGDNSAVLALQESRDRGRIAVPTEPVWSLIPVRKIAGQDNLPAGTKMFVRALAGAETVLLAAAPDGNRLSLRMNAVCRTPADAAALTKQLRDVTARLKDLIGREGQAPNPGDLSGILAAGAFTNDQTHVLGRWPVERVFLQSLAGGAL